MKMPKKSTIATALGAGLVGAGIGAGAALLADKKNRERIKKAVDEAKAQGTKALESSKVKMNHLTGDVKKRIGMAKPKSGKSSEE